MIDLLTLAYGETHVNLFIKCLLRSLSMKENFKALDSSDVEWTVFTDDESIKKIDEAIKITHPSIRRNIKSTSELRTYTDSAQSAIVIAAEKCLAKKSKLIFAPPDIFFGNGTIKSIIDEGKEEGSVVVFPHVRVRPEILDEMLPNKNADLVYLAWRHLHRSWLDAEEGHPRQNSFIGGVSWKRHGESTFSVIHRLPTPYLINFTDFDLKYFKLQTGFGHFDHMWPGELIKQGRQRYLASSDIAFAVEITEPEKNIPPAQGNPNEFWKKNFHNEINKGIVACFRY